MPNIHSSEHGRADVVIGLQHGDEGKGRFIDGLGADYDVIARYNGGPNAGHTIDANGHKLALHQVPSGVNYPDKKLFIGAQCVVNVEKLLAEIQEIEQHGISVRNRLRISAQASVIQPSHIFRDIATMGGVGTTKNGIGATYADQAARIEGNRQLDIRLGDLLLNTEWALQAIQQNLLVEMERYEHLVDTKTIQEFDAQGRMARLAQAFDSLQECIEKDPAYMLKQIRAGLHVLLEGAQAFGLDRTFGVTPDVTASNTGVAAAFVSTGIPVDYKGKAYGVAKLIPTRVGHGPFPTEFGGERSEDYCMAEGGNKHRAEIEKGLYGARVQDLLKSEDPLEVGIAIRMIGGEYGASTGRPRRPGVLDVRQLAQAIAINGVNEVFLTKGDSLVDFSRTREAGIPLSSGYTLDGQPIDYVPTTKQELRRVKPVVTVQEAFTDDISHIRDPHELPEALRKYLQTIQNEVGAHIAAVGVGPRREQVVHLNGALDQ